MTISTKLNELDLLKVEDLLWKEGNRYFDLHIKGKGKDEEERKKNRENWKAYRRLSDIFALKRRRAFLKSLKKYS
tara:strand:- start:483 stop:707 length:225 start_codon:yes stop_codon:yes gene_type:complete